MPRNIEIHPQSPEMIPSPAKDEQGKDAIKYSRPLFGFTEEKSTVPSRKIIKNIPKMDLNNIIELTQENEGANAAPKREKVSPPFVTTKGFLRYLRCIRYICRAFWKRSLQVEVCEQKLQIMVQKLKRKKCEIVLPPQATTKKVLVLDLDETLVYTTFQKPKQYDFQIQIDFEGVSANVYTTKRFGLDSFLFEMSKLYEIIVFTASQKYYADRVIDQIDPKGRIAHRLYRDDCILINKSYYLKNLNILGRPIDQIILVDDNALAELMQPENLYLIEPYTGNPKDRQLFRLSSFLRHIAELKTILPIEDSFFAFESIQIQLKTVKEDNPKRWHGLHRKTVSEVEALADSEQSQQAETTTSQMMKEPEGN